MRRLAVVLVCAAGLAACGESKGTVGAADALRAYLTKLLARNPDWVWTADDVWPLRDQEGFALRWKAAIPVGATVVHETGLDLVLVEGGLITRNEVYFDRVGLLAAMRGE